MSYLNQKTINLPIKFQGIGLHSGKKVNLDINPADVEEEMKKWLWRYKDGGQFAKA